MRLVFEMAASLGLTRPRYCRPLWDIMSILGGRAVLAPDERTNDQQVRDVEYNSDCEGCCIDADRVVDRAGEPAAERHARAAEQQDGWYSPRRFNCREQLANREHIGRDDAAEAESEPGRDG